MVSFRGQNGLGHAQIGFLTGFNSKFLTSPFHMGVPPPWAGKFHFSFVPFEISRNHALIPAADLGKGYEGLDFLLFLDLTKVQRAQKITFFGRLPPPPPHPPLLISRSESGTRCTVVVRRNPRALNDSPDETDLSYYFFYFLNNYLFDKLSSK